LPSAPSVPISRSTQRLPDLLPTRYHGSFRRVSHDCAQLRIHETPNASSHMPNRPEGMSLGGVVTLPSCESAVNNWSSSPFELHSMNTEKLLSCLDVSEPDGESDAMSTAWPPWASWLCITRACGSVFGWPEASG